MKKQSLLLIGGAMLAFASCQQENTTGGFTQEQVDSIVNARVEEQMMALQASNDSTINALAQMKADSIIAAMKGGSTTIKKTTTTTTKNTTVNNGGGTTKPTKPSTGSVTDRKSSQENSSNTSVTDRKSSGESKTNTSVSDRKSKQNP